VHSAHVITVFLRLRVYRVSSGHSRPSVARHHVRLHSPAFSLLSATAADAASVARLRSSFRILCRLVHDMSVTSHVLRSSLLLMLLTMALALEDRTEVEGDRPRSMEHNVNCETVLRSLNIEQLDSTPELHFHVDVQVRADIYLYTVAVKLCLIAAVSQQRSFTRLCSYGVLRSLIVTCLRYCSDVAQWKPTKLCTMFGRLLRCYTIHTFPGALDH